MEWEREQRDSALAERAAAAVAQDARRDQDRARARKNVLAQQADHAVRRAAKKSLDEAERAVQELEQRVSALGSQLNDPDLYDGSAANAKRAGRLDKELGEAQRALDAAILRWEKVERTTV